VSTDPRPVVAVVLAAGKGTRMRSVRPKVLHEVAGRPMLDWAVAAARGAGCQRVVVVVGHGADEVRAAFAREPIEWVEQREQRGTGHALAQVRDLIDGAARLVVLSGDVPLVRPATLAALVERADDAWGSMAVADLADPGSLGRVEASPRGEWLARIVEAADASPEQLANSRVNAGLYVLPAPEVFADLARLQPDNAKGELYLTDALSAAAARGETVVLHRIEDPAEAFGINDRAELARAHRALIDRHLTALAEAGVTVLEPARTVVEPGVAIGRDTILHPGAALLGATRVGEGCVIAQGSWVRDSDLGQGVTIEPYSVVDGARLEAGSRVGPFARLRPGAVIGEGARVGNFVEVKNTELGAGAKAGHLAYLGDAVVGEGANIGAGAVTCNYDGERKHETRIGKGAFVGSDTMLVAPVEVGEGASTAAGSVITRDVPPGALGVGRGKQRNVPGWAERRRSRRRPDDREE
jgi:bifunctional UDP-N-acetylglucosamine pyrophosphorylase/glucosamine-1-phosphate N-acetyltransferase